MLERDYSISDEVKALVEEVMSAALEVNCFTVKAVFVNFSGHVNQLEVRVVPDKNKGFTERIFSSAFYLENSDASYKLAEVLSELKKYLDEEG